MLALFAVAITIAQGPDSLILAQLPVFANLRDCAEEEMPTAPCRLTAPPPSAERAARLRAARFGVWTVGDTLHVVWQAPGDEVTQATLRGGLQLPLSRIAGSEVWALSLRLPGVDHATIDMRLGYDAGAGFVFDSTAQLVWRGPDAPPAPVRAEHLAGTLTTDSIESTALGMQRVVTWYLPPGAGNGTLLPVVYMGDGQSVDGWARLIDPLVARGDLPPVVIVGAHYASLPPDTPRQGIEDDLRAVEYMDFVAEWVGADSARVAARYEAHMRFFTEELVAWAERTLPISHRRNDRAVAGVSNSAYFARTLGVRHPERFGAVFGMSHNGPPLPPEADSTLSPAYFLAAGSVERRFASELEELAADLDARGIPNRVVIYPSGHDSVVWAELFPEAVRWWLETKGGN